MRRINFLLIFCLLLPLPTYAAPQITQKSSLTIALNSSPSGIIPALSTGILATLVGTQIFAGLVRPVSSSQEPIAPYLASSWKWHEHNNSITFFLRQNAIFHDGVSITAEDVAYSISTAKKYHPYGPAFALIKDIYVETPHQLTIRFTHPVPRLMLTLFSANFIPILPKHIYTKGRPLPLRPISELPVGSGPFRLESINKNRMFVLKRFPHFFLEGRPYLSTLTFSVYDDLNAMPLALQAGDVDLVGFLPSATQHDNLQKIPNIEVQYQGYAALGPKAFLYFNMEKKPFTDIRVRRAINHAIDKQFIVTNILQGNSIPLHGPFLPTTPFYTEGADTPYAYDIEKANTLLDAAGYPRGSDGKRFTMHVAPLPNARAVFIPILEFLRHSLARSIGVEVAFEGATSLSEWSRNVSAGKYQTALDIQFLWSDPIIGMHRTYHSNNIHPGKLWANMGRYSNAKVDFLLDTATLTLNADKRKRLYAEVQNLITQDSPAVYIGSIPYATAYRKWHGKSLKGLSHGMWGLLGPLDTIRWD